MDIEQKNDLKVVNKQGLSEMNFSQKAVAIQSEEGIVTVRNGNLRFSYGSTESTEVSTEVAGPNDYASLSSNVSYSISGDNAVTSYTVVKEDGRRYTISSTKPE